MISLPKGRAKSERLDTNIDTKEKAKNQSSPKLTLSLLFYLLFENIGEEKKGITPSLFNKREGERVCPSPLPFRGREESFLFFPSSKSYFLQTCEKSEKSSLAFPKNLVYQGIGAITFFSTSCEKMRKKFDQNPGESLACQWFGAYRPSMRKKCEKSLRG